MGSAMSSRSLALAAAAVLSLAALPARAERGAIEDDYPRALAAAKERSAPLLVDVWAPW